ncbi:hypothetical protein A7982_13321 [Minicystis rosea]|nr:hypothetical protein A7982_13321 [Minicystis rosea]
MLEGDMPSIKIHLFKGNNWENKVYRTVGRDVAPYDPTVEMNTYFVHSARMVADNLLHEAAHVRGYHHKNAHEWTSVPYMMNTIFEICTRSLYGPGTIDVKQ